LLQHVVLRTGARALGLATAILVAAVPGALAQSHHARVHKARASVGPAAVLGPHISTAGSPPTSAQCKAQIGIACYGPQDMRNQYDFNPTYAPGNGDAGAGQTIVIFDSFGSPTIQQDLATFDTSYGINAPPSFKVYQPEGNVTYSYLHDGAASGKSFQDKTEINWGYESTLDVEWAHAMAPNANIALVETPTAETEGVDGLQNLENAQQWALNNHIGTIWSDSFAATEQTFENPSVVQRMNQLYHTAASDGISAFFATGDLGAANYNKTCTGASPKCSIYSYATVNFPSSSPDVVSVGGTQIPDAPVSSTEPALLGYNPEQNWNDGYGSGGGGFSTVFPKPYYQTGITDPTGMRGLPDISYNAALISSILIYESFDPAGAGWVPIGGTSAAAPQWAAIDAIANNANITQNGAALGFLTPRLYQVYDNAADGSAFHDILTTNNSFAGVKGYNAGPGWDPTTGIGTPDVNNLVQALKATTPGTAP
jgi:subtilase family serine protease